MVTDVAVLTKAVLTLKVAVVLFGSTVTVAGTLATEVLLLDRVTTAPPLGAGAANVTVPIDEVPPCTVSGFNVT
jgi:hypothetical protein